MSILFIAISPGPDIVAAQETFFFFPETFWVGQFWSLQPRRGAAKAPATSGNVYFCLAVVPS